MTADGIYQALFFITWPAAVAYPVIYIVSAPFWRSRTGRALFIKALGVGLMVTVGCLYFLLGSDYWGRNAIRIGGMALVCVGVWAALIEMLHRLRKRYSAP